MNHQYPHLPKQYQPIAVIVQGTALAQTIATDPTAAGRCAQAFHDQEIQLRRQLTAALADRHDPALVGRAADLLVQTAITFPQGQLNPFSQDPQLTGMILAANLLALDYYRRHPEPLLFALRSSLEPDRPDPWLAIQTANYALTLLARHFMPLGAGEKLKDLFRELPAPLVMAGFGHCNALEFRARSETETPESTADFRETANRWLAAGAVTALDPAAWPAPTGPALRP